MSKSFLKNLTDSDYAQKRIAVFLQATGLTLGGMLILGGGGYLLDRALGTKPILFIIGLVAAYPVVQIMLYRKIKKS